MTGSSGPLAGIRIVEFAGLGPGPFAAMLLADLGADIVRIDRPGARPPRPSDVVLRGRPTVTADLKSFADHGRILELLSGADGLIEGFRPGVMERLGLGPEEVAAVNPRLVYGRMTGWGQSGPLAHTAGHDIGYLAITGALAAIGTPDQALPPLNLVGDYGGGALYLALGLLAALLSARETGRGQVVDAAICDGATSLMTLFYGWLAQGSWTEARGANLLDGGAPHYRVYRCADGLDLAVGPIEPQFFSLFMATIGLDIPAEQRTRSELWPAQADAIAQVLARRTRSEWLALFEGKDACVAPVLTLSEARMHPHLAARGSVIELDGIAQPAPSPRFSATPAVARPVHVAGATLEDRVALWSQ